MSIVKEVEMEKKTHKVWELNTWYHKAIYVMGWIYIMLFLIGLIYGLAGGE